MNAHFSPRKAMGRKACRGQNRFPACTGKIMNFLLPAIMTLTKDKGRQTCEGMELSPGAGGGVGGSSESPAVWTGGPFRFLSGFRNSDIVLPSQAPPTCQVNVSPHSKLCKGHTTIPEWGAHLLFKGADFIAARLPHQPDFTRRPRQRKAPFSKNSRRTGGNRRPTPACSSSANTLL